MSTVEVFGFLTIDTLNPLNHYFDIEQFSFNGRLVEKKSLICWLKSTEANAHFREWFSNKSLP